MLVDDFVSDDLASETLFISTAFLAIALVAVVSGVLGFAARGLWSRVRG